MKAKSEKSARGAGYLADIVKQGGFNQELFVEAGIVTREPPFLEIEVDGDVILKTDDLIVAEHLTKHSRIVTIEPQQHEFETPSYISFGSDNVSESMSAEGLGPHTHDVTSLTLDNVQNDFLAQCVKLTFDDELKLGERVLIVADDDTDEYYVIDRAVEYHVPEQ